MTNDRDRAAQLKLPIDESKAQSTAKAPKVWLCDICGAEVLDLHCKLRCTNCGFMRDCTDP